MSGITTHVLDVSRGRPAPDVAVSLEREADSGWEEVGGARTDDDGRAGGLGAGEAPEAGTYRIRFEVGDYFARTGTDAFYPRVEVTFRLDDPSEHYHVPILLGPFGYTTYRGS